MYIFQESLLVFMEESQALPLCPYQNCITELKSAANFYRLMGLINVLCDKETEKQQHEDED